MYRTNPRSYVLRGQPVRWKRLAGRCTPKVISDVGVTALQGMAAKWPAGRVAGLICGRAGELMPRAEFAVLMTGSDQGLQQVAGVPLGAAELDAVTVCLSPEATELRAIELAGCRSGWLLAGSITDSTQVVLLALLPSARSLSMRERRLFDTAIHVLQVAFSQDAVCKRLETINERFELALNSISQGVCFFDGSGQLLLANPRYAEIYSIDPTRIRPQMSLQDVVDLRREAGAFPRMTSDQYLDWRSRVNAENLLSRSVVELANGRVVEIHNQPMPDGGWVATHEDITARTGAEARVSHMARHDALTGVANRLLFHERLETALADASPSRRYAVLCLDLDGFKPVNDSFGHPVGDLLLQSVAGRLRHCTRQNDTVCRLGGDEFAILTHIDRPDCAGELATRIKHALSKPFQLGDLTVAVGVSVGIAWSEGDCDTPDDLLKRADVALYRAKEDERGSFRFFEPTMQEQLLGRLRLENELREAIVRQEFELFYQPLLDLQSGAVCAFEALLRWRHPERGLILPADFIPIAESSGLIVPLGAWVLMRACAEASSWPEHITVAVNLSVAQFKSKSLVAAVQQALEASGMSARRLELEVTESLLLEDDAGTMAALQTLSALGIRFSMDDFGTGHSSLAYLRRFPFTKLKIDRSYIRDMAHQADSLAIVRAILSLGRGLKMVTTAEGVETEAQLLRLREEGCDEVQGFLFSEPRPASEVPRMLLAGGRNAAGSVSVAA